MHQASPLSAWQWMGGQFEPCLSLPIEDRGFRYGMALFESLRVLHGTPLFCEPHLERLREACRQREFAVDEQALQAIGPILRSFGTDGFGRIYVTAGNGGPTEPADSCRVLVLLETRRRLEPAPRKVALSPEMHWPLFGGLKTANYWANLDALQRAERRGFDEALLFNEHAELVSGAVTNVFLVHGGAIRTPALACGARNGVVREWIMRQAPVRQCSLFLGDVESAEEIFFANSWQGITSVGQVEDRILAGGPVARRMAEAYARQIEAEAEAGAPASK